VDLISFIIAARHGADAANTVALSFNQFCFMPVIGLHMAYRPLWASG